jgi:hypothetical protein
MKSAVKWRHKLTKATGFLCELKGKNKRVLQLARRYNIKTITIHCKSDLNRLKL